MYSLQRIHVSQHIQMIGTENVSWSSRLSNRKYSNSCKNITPTWTALQRKATIIHYCSMMNVDIRFMDNDASIRHDYECRLGPTSKHGSRWPNGQTIGMNKSLQCWMYKGPMPVKRNIRIKDLTHDESDNQQSDSQLAQDHKSKLEGNSDAPVNDDQLTMSTQRDNDC